MHRMKSYERFYVCFFFKTIKRTDEITKGYHFMHMFRNCNRIERTNDDTIRQNTQIYEKEKETNGMIATADI